MDIKKTDNILYNDIYKKALEKNIQVLQMNKGDNIEVSDRIHFHILWPPIKSTNYYNNENNLSMVFVLKAYNYQILFTGDIEKEVEQKIVTEDYKYDVTAIKVPHHGSKTSSINDFITFFNPEYGIVSVGQNNFGHPSDEVLNRYKQNKVKILRTDENGMITINILENKIAVKPFIEDKLLFSDIILKYKFEILYVFIFILISIVLIKLYPIYNNI